MSTFVDVVQQGRKMSKIHPLTQLENGQDSNRILTHTLVYKLNTKLSKQKLENELNRHSGNLQFH